MVGTYLLQLRFKNELAQVDEYLLPIYAILSGWGLLTIWRLSSYFGIRQMVWLVISYALIYLAVKQKRLFHYLRHYKYTWLFIGLSLLLLTFLFGTYPGGSGPELWLGFRGLYFQPSEILKILLIVFLAAYFAEIPDKRRITFKVIAPTLGIILFALTFLVLQQDLGTALIFSAIYTMLLFLIIGRKRVIGFGGLVVLLAAGLGYQFIPLVRIRVQAWLNPWLYSSTGAYQIIQSTLAMAAGGILGGGVGLGSPNIVPIAHSDFIFSTIAEETGLVGSLALILLLALFMLRCFAIARNAATHFQRYLAAGLTVMLTFQSILIIGGNIRFFPITGVPLPFLSYGGSSLLTSSAAVALLATISASQTQIQPSFKTRQSFQIVGSLFLIAFLLLGLVCGWWSFVRADDLQTRMDNPRLALADLFVPRGAIISSDGELIASSQGKSGSLVRVTHYPLLSTVTGFNHTRYGKSGLENSFNDYLRGFKGYPASTIWFTHLVYDQPPQGLDVRLTINLKLQEVADQYLNEKKGAAVLMRADSGEVLAMASHPSFDANTLAENWATWISSQEGEFLNRAVQGAYPIGNMSVPLLMLSGQEADDEDLLLDYSFYASGKNFTCSFEDAESAQINDLQNGCVNAILALAKNMDTAKIYNSLARLQLFSEWDIGLPINPTPSTPGQTSTMGLFFGSAPLRISPLQLARAAAAITNQGTAPAPYLVSAVNTPAEGWVLFPQEEAAQISDSAVSRMVQEAFAYSAINGWEFTGRAFDQKSDFSWYLAGTTKDWQGNPLVLAVIIEEDDLTYVQYIGREILKAAYSQ